MKDGDIGDDDRDDDGPRDPDPEGRVEKYIGVKVKACIPLQKFAIISLGYITSESTIYYGKCFFSLY